MPRSACLEPRCPHPAHYRGRCPLHSKEHDRSIDRAGRAVYSKKRWKVTRRRKLFTDPLCELNHPGCERLAVEVHHHTPLSEGGAAHDQANLVSVCKPCHSRETARELGRGKAVRQKA